MTDVHTVSARLDTSSFEKLEGALKETARAGQQADAAVEGVASGTQRAGAGARSMASGTRQAASATQNMGAQARAATGSLNSMGAAMRQANAHGQAYARTSSTAGFATANLAAQFNDIGVMLASGQSPLLLAAQQGTQINQVLTQMRATGQSTSRALVSAFTSIISPMSILTIGVIAGGAALGQWVLSAFQAEEEAKTLDDAIGDLTSAFDAYEDSLKRARSGMEDLRSEFGPFAAEAKRLLDLQNQLDLSAAMREVRRTAIASDTSVDELGLFQRRSAGVPDTEAIRRTRQEYRTLLDEMTAGTGDLTRLTGQQMDAINQASRAIEEAMLGAKSAVGDTASAYELVTRQMKEAGLPARELLALAQKRHALILEAVDADGKRTEQEEMVLRASSESLLVLQRQIAIKEGLAELDDKAAKEAERAAERARKNAEWARDRLQTMQLETDVQAAIAQYGKDHRVTLEAQDRLADALIDREIERRGLSESIAFQLKGQAAALRQTTEAARQALEAEREREREAKKARREAERRAKEAAREMERIRQEQLRPTLQFVDNIAGAWGDWLADGARDFDSFTDRIKDSFKRLLADLLARQASVSIMRMLGLDVGGGVGGGAAAMNLMLAPSVSPTGGTVSGGGYGFQPVGGLPGARAPGFPYWGQPGQRYRVETRSYAHGQILDDTLERAPTPRYIDPQSFAEQLAQRREFDRFLRQYQQLNQSLYGSPFVPGGESSEIIRNKLSEGLVNISAGGRLSHSGARRSQFTEHDQGERAADVVTVRTNQVLLDRIAGGAFDRFSREEGAAEATRSLIERCLPLDQFEDLKRRANEVFGEGGEFGRVLDSTGKDIRGFASDAGSTISNFFSEDGAAGTFFERTREYIDRQLSGDDEVAQARSQPRFPHRGGTGRYYTGSAENQERRDMFRAEAAELEKYEEERKRSTQALIDRTQALIEQAKKRDQQDQDLRRSMDRLQESVDVLNERLSAPSLAAQVPEIAPRETGSTGRFRSDPLPRAAISAESRQVLDEADEFMRQLREFQRQRDQGTGIQKIGGVGVEDPFRGSYPYLAVQEASAPITLPVAGGPSYIMGGASGYDAELRQLLEASAARAGGGPSYIMGGTVGGGLDLGNLLMLYLMSSKPEVGLGLSLLGALGGGSGGGGGGGGGGLFGGGGLSQIFSLGSKLFGGGGGGLFGGGGIGGQIGQIASGLFSPAGFSGTGMGSGLGGVGSALFGSQALAGSMAAPAAAQAFLSSGAFTANAGAAAVYGTGFGGGFNAALSSGNGLLSIGANAGAAGGGIGAWLGAAAPMLLGAVAIGLLMSSKKLLDSGIDLAVADDQLTAETYERWKKSRLFGLISSTSTKTKPLDEEAAGPLRDMVTSMHTQVEAAAETLGFGADALENFSYRVKLSFMDLDEDERAAKVEETMNAIGDRMAFGLIAGAEARMEVLEAARTELSETRGRVRNVQHGGGRAGTTYRRGPSEAAIEALEENVRRAEASVASLGEETGVVGLEFEGARERLTSLANALTTANAALDQLGHTAFEVGLRGAQHAEELVNAFGSAEQFQQAASAYYQTFYTEAERMADTRQRVIDSLSGGGLAETLENLWTMPSEGALAGYRGMVEAMDLTTGAQRELYTELLQLAPEFALVAEYEQRLADERRATAEATKAAAEAEAERARQEAEAKARREQQLLADAARAGDAARKATEQALSGIVQEAEGAAQSVANLRFSPSRIYAPSTLDGATSRLDLFRRGAAMEQVRARGAAGRASAAAARSRAFASKAASESGKAAEFEATAEARLAQAKEAPQETSSQIASAVAQYYFYEQAKEAAVTHQKAATAARQAAAEMAGVARAAAAAATAHRDYSQFLYAVRHLNVEFEVGAKGAQGYAKAITGAFDNMDEFTQRLGAYYQNFFSEEERLRNLQADLALDFDYLGLAMPRTRQEFRALVEAQDLSTAAGQKTFAALIDIADQFAALTEESRSLEDALRGQQGIFRTLAREIYVTSAPELSGLQPTDDTNALLREIVRAIQSGNITAARQRADQLDEQRRDRYQPTTEKLPN